jgi:hypothetical protein
LVADVDVDVGLVSGELGKSFSVVLGAGEGEVVAVWPPEQAPRVSRQVSSGHVDFADTNPDKGLTS